MHKMFALMLTAVEATTLLALGGCTTHDQRKDLKDPGCPMLSSGEADNECAPCMDPICGDRIGSWEGTWRSSYRGVEYDFDCEECKSHFQADPDRYTRH